GLRREPIGDQQGAAHLATVLVRDVIDDIAAGHRRHVVLDYRLVGWGSADAEKPGRAASTVAHYLHGEKTGIPITGNHLPVAERIFDRLLRPFLRRPFIPVKGNDGLRRVFAVEALD